MKGIQKKAWVGSAVKGVGLGAATGAGAGLLSKDEDESALGAAGKGALGGAAIGGGIGAGYGKLKSMDKLPSFGDAKPDAGDVAGESLNEMFDIDESSAPSTEPPDEGMGARV